jgi:RNA polymerase-binding transcription factor DksA
VATDEARSEIHLALEAAARSVLADIDAALLRVEQGRYGHCQRCGERMTVERLNALPMAALCGSCQRRLELPKAETAQYGRGT